MNPYLPVNWMGEKVRADDTDPYIGSSVLLTPPPPLAVPSRCFEDQQKIIA